MIFELIKNYADALGRYASRSSAARHHPPAREGHSP